MRQPKFTAGPWRINSQGNVKTSYGTLMVTGVRLPMGNHPNEKEAEANARLLANSPDMYDLLATIENDDGLVPAWLWTKIQNLLNSIDNPTTV